MLRIGVLLATTGLWAIPALADDVVISVGPGGQYQRIADAVARADADTDPGNYYVINVVPGTYRNDFPEVTRPMTIQVDPAFPGQQAILMATIPLPNQKGIILTTSSLHVNGLVFTGAQIDESLGGNGAGIRDQNPENTLASLVVENSVFHDNQAGILQGDDIAETVTIINSQFMNNGTFHPHAVYIDEAASLTVTGSLFCGQLVAHDIKSRASATTVVNSTIYDGQGDPAIGCRDGSSSFAIDVPNGGVTVISGNLIIQGPSSPNFKMVAYSEEGLIPGAANSLMVSGNTFINIGGQSAIGVYEPICVVPAQLMNNTFQNVATPVYPPECAVEQTVSPPPPPPPSPPPAPPPSPPPAPPPPSPPPPPIACTPVYDANFNLTCQ